MQARQLLVPACSAGQASAETAADIGFAAGTVIAAGTAAAAETGAAADIEAASSFGTVAAGAHHTGTLVVCIHGDPDQLQR